MREATHTVDNRSPPVIQLLLPPSRSPKFRPLTLPVLPLAPVVSQMVISKPQLGELCFTEGDREAERRQINFPIRGIHTVLREPSRELSAGLRMLSDRLTLKATWKSSRNILSKLTCAPGVGGAGTVPFGPITGPGSDSDGELVEVPLSRPKNSLTAPSTSPVVYKSRPIPQDQAKRKRLGLSYQVHARFREQPLRTLSIHSEIYPRFPRKTARTPSPVVIRKSSAPFSGNRWLKVSGETVE